MKRKRILFVITSVIFMLFIGTLLYAILRDDDPYRYFTGLGDNISVAPDDSKIAFSYYLDGEESVYTSNPDGTNVRKITNSTNRQDRNPKFSPDGKMLTYLSKHPDGTQNLRVINQDGSEGRQLTDNDIHVTDAIFSSDGGTIYFVAVEAEEFKKGEESREGFDLFSMNTDGKQVKRLTDTDHFSMNDLFLSPDGHEIYYSEFDGNEERIYSYSLDDGAVNSKPSILPEKIANAQSFYEAQLSPDGQYLAFTEVSKETQESSLFEYELFLLDLHKQNVERLTDLGKAVTSPVFFHKEDKIAFLENTNWSKALDVYQLRIIDLTTNKMEVVNLDTPESAGGNPFVQALDRTANGLTLSILYILLMGLLSMYLHDYYPDKAYLPSIVSFSFAIFLFVSSFVIAAMVNPWYGIGLGMLAAVVFGCSIMVVLFTVIYKRIMKNSRL